MIIILIIFPPQPYSKRDQIHAVVYVPRATARRSERLQIDVLSFGDVCSHVMCCEVFWRNDTLYNAEVNCYSSSLTPHDAQCTNWECKWGRSGRGWRECPEVRQQLGVDGAPRQRSSPSMIHEGMSKKTLNSKWSKVFFFLSPMTEETKVLLNWPCWSPCSTMNESLWMNCHCMTTGTKRVEKFNCYFAVCFVFFSWHCNY